jgi:hypothetical protein
MNFDIDWHLPQMTILLPPSVSCLAGSH